MLYMPLWIECRPLINSSVGPVKLDNHTSPSSHVFLIYFPLEGMMAEFWLPENATLYQLYMVSKTISCSHVYLFFVIIPLKVKLKATMNSFFDKYDLFIQNEYLPPHRHALDGKISLIKHGHFRWPRTWPKASSPTLKCSLSIWKKHR